MIRPIERSWLFEIRDSAELVVRSYTLILPPSSIQIKYSQRVSITKTFGNAFIDDYGSDNPEITISGLSGYSKVLPTYRSPATGFKGGLGRPYREVFGNRPLVNTARSALRGVNNLISGVGSLASRAEGIAKDPSSIIGDSFDGVGAFFALRDDIIRYKEEFEDYDQYTLRAYDLFTREYYDCTLMEFSRTQSADKPLWINYSMHLFVHNRGKVEEVEDGFIDDILGIVSQVESSITNVSNFLVNTFDLLSSIAVPIEQFFMVAQFFEQFLDLLRSPFEDIKQLVNDKVDQVKSLVELLRPVFQVSNDVRVGRDSPRMFESMENIVNQIQKSYDSLSIDTRSYVDTLKSLRGLREVFNKSILEQSRKMSLVDGKGVSAIVDGVTTEEDIYGVRIANVHQNDSWQLIASRELRDISKWTLIRRLNKNVDLSMVDNVYIPYLSSQVDPNVSKFVASLSPASPYGVDLKIVDGDFVLTEGDSDFEIVSGVDNAVQHINNLVSSVKGSYLVDLSYGWEGAFGFSTSNDLSLSYIGISIQAALEKDYRIVSVKNIRITREADAIFVSFYVNLINREQPLYIDGMEV